MNYEMHPKMKYIYIGIDTHKITQTATIINCFNEKLESLTFNNDKKGYNALLNMAHKHEINGLTSVYGLEDTKHLGYGLAAFLLNNNCLVKSITLTLLIMRERKVQ